MSDVLTPEPADVTNETLHEHLELSHYIEVFRASAERVRRVIFIMMILSVVILVAQWNTTKSSWLPHRYQELRDIYLKADPLHHRAGAVDKIVQSRTGQRFQTRAELEQYLGEYLRQRVEKVFLVEIPGLGVTFDINDLGNFCGLSYLLLLALLLFSMMREHENLYLAMFKVRRLHDHDTRKLRGESAANYLYHALAMSQVLAAPPTLAQWKPSRAKRVMFHLLFFVPVAVEGYITWVNYDTVEVVRTYGDTNRIMRMQYALFLLNALIATLAFLYARACNIRWDGAFRHVNPKLEYVNPEPWHLWVRLPFLPAPDVVQRRLWAQFIDQLEIVPPTAPVPLEPTSYPVLLDPKNPRIRHRDYADMANGLVRKAKAEGKVTEIISGKVTSSTLTGTKWEVTARFDAAPPAVADLGPRAQEPETPEESPVGIDQDEASKT